MANRIRDDLDRDVILLRAPQRIVSLVPSDTLTLFDLGVGDRIVGRTRYCVEPVDGVGDIPTVGGTKDPDLDAICALAPDLILGNQEENTRKALGALVERGQRVFVGFPRRVADGIKHMARIARMLEIQGDATVKDVVRRGYEVIKEAEALAKQAVPVPTFVPIWMDPLMTFRNDTFADDMLTLVGATNVFEGRKRYYPLAADLGNADPLADEAVGPRDTRYPRISLEEVQDKAPELVLLPDEPHEFTDTDKQVFMDLDMPAATNGRIEFCDGRDLFWHGSRSVEAVPRLRALVDSMRSRAYPRTPS